MKVFGIGWAKTGTTSLGVALARLGFSHRSQDLAFVDAYHAKRYEEIYSETDKYDSFDDWPWLLMWEQFDGRYPDAKFVLTTRDEDAWLRSYESMLADQGVASEAMNAIRRRLYGLDFPNVSSTDLVDRYRKHNEDVMAYFSNRPEKLLVVDWSAGQGYRELCGFLRLPVPPDPFPHANKAADRKAGRLKRIVRKLFRK